MNPGDFILGIDLETGGVDPSVHALLEFGFVLMDHEFNELTSDSHLVFPEPRMTIHPQAAEKNKYDPALWDEQAVSLATVTDKFMSLLDSIQAQFTGVVWAHQCSFEERFLRAQMPRAWSRLSDFRCSQRWLRAWYKAKRLPSNVKGALSLEGLCRLAGYTNRDAHTAHEDCMAMMHGLRFLRASGVPYPYAEAAA